MGEGNTPVDSVILINPTWQDFRELSKRSIFVSFKDGSALLWHKSMVGEWNARLNALGVDVRKETVKMYGWNSKVANAFYTERYLSLGDADVKKIKGKYRVDYWIVPTDFKSNLSTEYTDNNFKVLKT